MSTSLFRVNVGQVGELPGKVLLKSNLTKTEVIVPGFINSIEGSSDVQVNPTDIIEATLANDELVIFAPSFGAGGVITLVTMADSSGSSSNFEYPYIWFVSSAGSDTNDGHSFNTPLETLTAALNSAQGSSAISGQRKIIWVLDGATYSENLAIFQMNVDFYAPNAVLADCTITMTIPATTSDQGIAGNTIFFNKLINVQYEDTVASVCTDYNVITLKANTVLGTDILSRGHSVIVDFDTWDFSTCSLNVVYNSGSNNQAYFIKNAMNLTTEDPLLNVDAVSWSRVSGVIGDVPLSSGGSFVQSTDVDIDVTWINSVVISQPPSNISFNITSSLNTAAPIGWQTLVVRNGGSGNIRVTADGGINVISVPNNPETAGDGGWFILRYLGASNWFVGGAVQNAAFVAANVYVSKLNGSDVTGDGTINKPFASFGAAVTAIGVPANTTTIICLDSESYNENIVIPVGAAINIEAGDASLSPATGDALTINTSSQNHIINFGLIFPISGDAIVIPDNATVLCNLGAMIGNATIGDGIIVIRAANINGDLSVTGSGNVSYFTPNKVGTDTAAVFGVSSEGIRSLAFSINGNYTIPLVDGNAGDVLTTDGAGVASWQPSSGGAGGWSMITIPWNAWLGSTGSFQSGNDINVGYLAPYSARSGGSPVSASSLMIFGQVTFTVLASGTYNFTFEHLVGNDLGIMKLDIDSGNLVQQVDFYSAGSGQKTASFTHALTAGDHTIDLYVDSKNGSSSNYNILPQTSLCISRIA